MNKMNKKHLLKLKDFELKNKTALKNWLLERAKEQAETTRGACLCLFFPSPLPLVVIQSCFIVDETGNSYALTKENYIRAKKIIAGRLADMNVSDYEIRQNEENGNILLQLSNKLTIIYCFLLK